MMLTPSLSANENSPLATTGGGASVRLGALTVAQFSLGRHTEHLTLTAVLSRIVNTTRATRSDGPSDGPTLPSHR